MNQVSYQAKSVKMEPHSDQSVRDSSILRLCSLTEDHTDARSRTVDDNRLAPGGHTEPCGHCNGVDTNQCPTSASHIELPFDMMYPHFCSLAVTALDGVVCQNCSSVLFRPDGKLGTGVPKCDEDRISKIFPDLPTVFSSSEESLEIAKEAKKHLVLDVPFYAASTRLDSRPLLVQEDLVLFAAENLLKSGRPRKKKNDDKPSVAKKPRKGGPLYEVYEMASTVPRSATRDIRLIRIRQWISVCEGMFDADVFFCVTPNTCSKIVCVCKTAFKNWTGDKLSYCVDRASPIVMDVLGLEAVPPFIQYNEQTANDTYFGQLERLSELFGLTLIQRERFRERSAVHVPKKSGKLKAEDAQRIFTETARCYEIVDVALSNRLFQLRGMVEEVEAAYAISPIGCQHQINCGFEMVRSLENRQRALRHPIYKCSPFVPDSRTERAAAEEKAVERNRQLADELEPVVERERASVAAFTRIRDRIRAVKAPLAEECSKTMLAMEERANDLKSVEVRPNPKADSPLGRAHAIAEQFRKRIVNGHLYCSFARGGCGAFQRKLKMVQSSLEFGPVPSQVEPNYLTKIRSADTSPQKMSTSWARGILIRMKPEDRLMLFGDHKVLDVFTSVMPVPAPSVVPAQSSSVGDIRGITTDSPRVLQQDTIMHKFRDICKDVVALDKKHAELEAFIGRPMANGEWMRIKMAQLMPPLISGLRKLTQRIQDRFSCTVVSNHRDVPVSGNGQFSRVDMASKSSVKSVSERFKAKHGFARAGFRNDFSSRAVITAFQDGNKVDEIVFFKTFAQHHSTRTKVIPDDPADPNNPASISNVHRRADAIGVEWAKLDGLLDAENQAVLRGKQGISSIKRLENPDMNTKDVFPTIKWVLKANGRMVYLRTAGAKPSSEICVGDWVDFSLESGKVIIFNRAPTLSPQSIQALKTVVPDDPTLIDQNQKAVCKRLERASNRQFGTQTDLSVPFGLDCDGDVAAAIIMQDEASARIAEKKLGVEQNVVHTDFGGAALKPVQGRIMAMFDATNAPHVVKRSFVLEVCLNLSAFAGMSVDGVISRLRTEFEIDISSRDSTCSSRLLVSTLFPAGFQYKYEGVEIKNGLLIEGAIHGKHMNVDQFSILKKIAHDFDNRRFLTFIDDLAWFARRWNCEFGYGLSHTDMHFSLRLQQAVYEQTRSMLAVIETKANSRMMQYHSEVRRFLDRKQPGQLRGRFFNSRYTRMATRCTDDIQNIHTTGGADIQAATKKLVEAHLASIPLKRHDGNQYINMFIGMVKGKIGDLIEMLVQGGIQMPAGKLCEPLLNDRFHCALPSGRLSLYDRGFVANSFMSGLSHVEKVAHEMNGRHKQAMSSHGVARMGSAQRMMETRLLDIHVNWENNIVDPAGHLYRQRGRVQDHRMDQTVSMPFEVLETAQVKQDRSGARSRIPFPRSVQGISQMAAFERRVLKDYDESGRWTAPGDEEEREWAENEFSLLCENRAMYMAHRDLDGGQASFPTFFDTDSILATLRSQCVPGTEPCPLLTKPSTLIPIVNDLLAKIQLLRHPKSTRLTLDRDFLTEWYIQADLSLHRIYNVYKLSEQGLRLVCERILSDFKRGLTRPGYAAGGEASSGIGAPLTQASLNVKHFICGVVRGNNGAKRLTSLASETCPPEDNIVKVQLKTIAELKATSEYIEGITVHADMSPDQIRKRLIYTHPYEYVTDVVVVPDIDTDDIVKRFLSGDRSIEHVHTKWDNTPIPMSAGFCISKCAARIDVYEEDCKEIFVDPVEWLGVLFGGLVRATHVMCLYNQRHGAYVVYVRFIHHEKLMDGNKDEWVDIAAHSSFGRIISVITEREREFKAEKAERDAGYHPDSARADQEDEEEDEEEEEEEEEDGAHWVDDLLESGSAADADVDSDLLTQQQQPAEQADDSEEKGEEEEGINEELDRIIGDVHQDVHDMAYDEAAAAAAAAAASDDDGAASDQDEPSYQDDMPDPESASAVPEDDELKADDTYDDDDDKEEKRLSSSSSSSALSKKRHRKLATVNDPGKPKKRLAVGGSEKNRFKKQIIYSLPIALRNVVYNAIDTISTDTGIVNVNFDPATKVVTLLVKPETKKTTKPDALRRWPPIMTKVLSNPAFKIETVHMCNIPLAQALCGIAKAEKFLRAELGNIMAEYGVPLSPDHFAILASWITFRGSLESIAKTSPTTRSAEDPLQPVCYQDNSKNLFRLIQMSKESQLTGVLSSLLFGRTPRLADCYPPVPQGGEDEKVFA